MRRWLWIGLTSAVIAVTPPALGAGTPVDRATEAESEKARDVYTEAKKSYDAGDFQKALDGFRASYDIVASPNSHLMMAKCLKALGHPADAYREVKAALPEAEAAAAFNEKYKRTADDGREQLESLRQSVGFVTIRVPEGESGALTLNGASIDPATLGEPVVVDPGDVKVVWTGASGNVERSAKVGAGGTALIELGDKPATNVDVAPPPDPTTGDEESGVTAPIVIGIVVASIGVTGMILFGTFGTLSNQTFEELEQECVNNACPNSFAQDIDRGKTHQVVANTSLIVGVSGLIAGTALILTQVASGDEDDDPTVAIGPGSFMLRGSF